VKILLIGHSVEDHLLSNAKEIITPDGIFYSALGYKFVKQEDDEIFLNTVVEQSNENLFSIVYDKLNKKYVKIENEIPKVFLTIHENKERDECYNKVTKNLEINFNEVNIFNGIHLNMVTGFDVTLNQVEELRNNFKGLIYIDVHSLSRGLGSDMKREFRTIPEFERWAKSVDIIQVNENELFTLDDEKDTMKIINKILSMGVKFIIVTKGNLGARVYWLHNEEINSIFVSALKIEKENKEGKSSWQVGCGDIFGSVFFYFYLKTNDLKSALIKANYLAGLTASKNNFSEGSFGEDLLNMRPNVFA